MCTSSSEGKQKTSEPSPNANNIASQKRRAHRTHGILFTGGAMIIHSNLLLQSGKPLVGQQLVRVINVVELFHDLRVEEFSVSCIAKAIQSDDD